jgi:hypothetical protein
VADSRDVRTLQARFAGAEPAEHGDATGVVLEFEPVRARLDVPTIRDFAELGPALTIPAVAGLGKVLRILRAARIAAPRDALALVGRDAEILALLERARGALLRLSVRRRARWSFVAWTERGVETVHDVVDVLESGEHYVVLRRGARAPVRFARATVSRRQTRRERWYEVLGIERA